MAIERFRMMDRGGKPIPNPWRFLCHFGHWHPTRRHAVKCHERMRKNGVPDPTKEGAK